MAARKSPSGTMISEEQYLEAIRQLHRSGPETPPDQLAEGEYQLMIDRKLGKDFPQDKREVMLAIYRVMCHERDTLMAQFLSGSLTPEAYSEQLHALLQGATRQYERILGPSQLEAFTGAAPGEAPALPIEPSNLKLDTF
jgi:hypothetical protein